MGYDLDPVFKEVLVEIDFLRRYEALSQKNRSPVLYEEAKELSVEATLGLCEKLGYEATYFKNENCYKVGVKKLPDYEIGFTICLTYGVAEFIWTVSRHRLPVAAGSWDTYVSRLLSPDAKINPPLFSNEENLEQLLYGAFALYEDFKHVLISKYDAAAPLIDVPEMGRVADGEGQGHGSEREEKASGDLYEDETYFNINILPEELRETFHKAYGENDFSTVLDRLEENYEYSTILDTNLLLFYSYVELTCALSAYVDDFPETLAKLKAKILPLDKTPQVMELQKLMKTVAKKMKALENDYYP